MEHVPSPSSADERPSIERDVPADNHLPSDIVTEYSVTRTRQEILIPELVNRVLHFWYKKYQPWFPILHATSFDKIRDPADLQYDLVRKALTTVVLLDLQNLLPQERHLAEQSRDYVMQHAPAHSSLQSVQALLIVSIHFFTAGQMTQYWSIMAICRR